MNKNTAPLGLYIHIPFCKSKCIYCDFYSLPAAQPAVQDRFLQILCRHLDKTAPTMAPYQIDTVYFGGGTPSCLGAPRLCRLLQNIRAQYRLAPNAEITLEANPDSLGTPQDLRALLESGFNRLSLGVQSADGRQLRLLGRPHTFAQARQAVRNARSAGFDNISLDLIYGLPDQDLSSWRATLEQTAALNPDHLSCYGLKVEEGTPLWNLQNSLNLPDADAQADMYLWTAARLEELGYQQYEISNFAHPGRESRHNLKYWTLAEYAGFGPGAHSDFGGVRYAFLRDLEGYCRGIEEGTDILSERTEISPEERAEEYLMLGLRLTRGVSAEEFERRFHIPFGPIQTQLDRFRQAGLAHEEAGRWHLTPKGFLVSNPIIGQVLDALDTLITQERNAHQ